MSDLNDDKKVSDLIELLVRTSGLGKIKVQVMKDDIMTIVVDGIPNDFRVGHDSHTNRWYLED